jgi:hypothetical protein
MGANRMIPPGPIPPNRPDLRRRSHRRRPGRTSRQATRANPPAVRLRIAAECHGSPQSTRAARTHAMPRRMPVRKRPPCCSPRGPHCSQGVRGVGADAGHRLQPPGDPADLRTAAVRQHRRVRVRQSGQADHHDLDRQLHSLRGTGRQTQLLQDRPRRTVRDPHRERLAAQPEMATPLWLCGGWNRPRRPNGPSPPCSPHPMRVRSRGRSPGTGRRLSSCPGRAGRSCSRPPGSAGCRWRGRMSCGSWVPAAGRVRPGCSARTPRAVRHPSWRADWATPTVEPAAGSAQPTTDPVVILPLA